MKYLGVTLDEQLKFNKHIEIVHNKAVNRLGMLRHSRDFLDRESALTLYQCLNHHSYHTATLYVRRLVEENKTRYRRFKIVH